MKSIAFCRSLLKINAAIEIDRVRKLMIKKAATMALKQQML